MQRTIQTRSSELLAIGSGADAGGSVVQIYPASGGAGLVDLSDGTVVIGREQSCQIVLADDSASRRHAAIEWAGDGYYLTDLDSTNGTFLNDLRVERQKLAAGDRICVGNHIFKFLSDDHIEAQYHETVYQMMTTDGLTLAYNKRYLLESLDRELSRSHRLKRPVSLLMLDADHFKMVNDTHGHMVGDGILRQLCDRARSLLRKDEMLGRFGGEEFAIVLGDSNAEEAEAVAEQLRETIGGMPFVIDHLSLNVTISIGVAETLGYSLTTPADLIQRADAKLYEAKSNGRNQVCVATDA